MVGNQDIHQVCSTHVFIYAFVSVVCTYTEPKTTQGVFWFKNISVFMCFNRVKRGECVLGEQSEHTSVMC